MRIGIDARFFGPVGKGLGRYTERLIENLEQLAEEHEFVVFLRKENFDLYRPKSPRFRKVLADFRWYSVSEQFRFPPLIRRERIDLMHFLHFNLPVLTFCPFVVTIHDLILLRYPTRRATRLNAAVYGLKYAAYRAVITLAAYRARKIITVSECTKRDIVKELRVKPERVIVTYEAADPPARRPQATSAEISDDSILGHGITKPYFLYVGNAYPHKNLERLLKVFKKLREGGLDAQLVLVGKMDYFYERLKEEARVDGLLERNDAVFYGYAEEADLADLYRKARTYVFPSLLEGFGLPPLEAMRYGTPVAASNSSCLPEILADAAEYFDPEDDEDIARALRAAFEDELLRARLAERGQRRVERFSWRDCAERTYQTYLSSLHP